MSLRKPQLDPEKMDRLEELLEEARRLPPMTDEQREEQRLDFAYGNLACSTNHKPVLEAFWAVASGRGWTRERFAKWAAGREWRTL